MTAYTLTFSFPQFHWIRPKKCKKYTSWGESEMNCTQKKEEKWRILKSHPLIWNTLHNKSGINLCGIRITFSKIAHFFSCFPHRYSKRLVRLPKTTFQADLTRAIGNDRRSFFVHVKEQTMKKLITSTAIFNLGEFINSKMHVMRSF